jgi:short-subunit dehydrogenase
MTFAAIIKTKHMTLNQNLTVVVIEASGTIGKSLSKSLEEKGAQVVRVSRSSGDSLARLTF